MKRMSQVLCGAAIMLMAGAAISPVHARALFAYPMQGQTPEQENADRSACHDWAVVQSGYDPTLLYAAQRGVIVTQSGNTFPPTTGVTRLQAGLPQSGGTPTSAA